MCKIKNLTWVKRKNYDCWDAKTYIEYHDYMIYCSERTNKFEITCMGYGVISADTLEDAKNWANEDWKSKIQKCLLK